MVKDSAIPAIGEIGAAPRKGLQEEQSEKRGDNLSRLPHAF